MTPSPRIVDFIKGYERLKLKPYFATESERARGILSIGYGHTKGVKPDDVWTIDRAEQQFTLDLADFGSGVLSAINGAPTTQDQFDALVSLVYNIGEPNFATSSVRTNHIAGHYQTAALAFGLWIKQRDEHHVLQIVPGLIPRRAAEAAIYQGH